MVAIPPSQFKAVFGSPERVIESHVPQFESVSAEYTMRDPMVFPGAPFGLDFIKRIITKRYGSVAKELAEEVGLAFDEFWGVGTDWKTIKPLLSFQEIASRATNRVVIGLPLCKLYMDVPWV
jgi:hypothetical protein